MSDVHLNNVMEQYFPGSISSTFDGSEKLNGRRRPPSRKEISKPLSVRWPRRENSPAAISLPQSSISCFRRERCSTTMPAPSAASRAPGEGKEEPDPDDDEADSLHGLGGYHGSVHTGSGTTIYYAVGVYSRCWSDGTENGIVVFDQPWKNVVATFYHELNEARTDSDVEDAIRAGNDPKGVKFLGWTSKQGEECGDFPGVRSRKQPRAGIPGSPLAAGGRTVPVQFQYSDNVHGPEGPRSNAGQKRRHASKQGLRPPGHENHEGLPDRAFRTRAQRTDGLGQMLLDVLARSDAMSLR